MQYRRLGRSGLKVSPLCLGTMNFGGPTDEATAQRIVARAREDGVNFIDTADTYGGGRSEEITGRAIANTRDQWVLATKVGNRTGEGPNGGGLTRHWIMQGAERSLRRLGTDRIDLYYLHKEDLDTPLEETVRAMADLIRQGKVRAFGVSNHRSWRVADICRLCDQIGIDRPLASQPYYHALNRMAEAEQLPACAHFGLGVVVYSPLARGILTGKYEPGAAPPAETRAGRNDRRMMQAEWREDSLHLARRIRQHAESRGVTASQFAVAWVLNNALVTAAIAGPRTLAQWEDYGGALGYAVTAEDEALIDAIAAPGHPATPGYNDPSYPIEGRVPRGGAPAA